MSRVSRQRAQAHVLRREIDRAVPDVRRLGQGADPMRRIERRSRRDRARLQFVYEAERARMWGAVIGLVLAIGACWLAR